MGGRYKHKIDQLGKLDTIGEDGQVLTGFTYFAKWPYGKSRHRLV